MTKYLYDIIDICKLQCDALKMRCSRNYSSRDFILGQYDTKTYFIVVRGIAMFKVSEKSLFTSFACYENTLGGKSFFDASAVIDHSAHKSAATWCERFEKIGGREYRVFDADGGAILIEKKMTDYIAAPDCLKFEVVDNGAIIGRDACGAVACYMLPLKK